MFEWNKVLIDDVFKISDDNKKVICKESTKPYKNIIGNVIL